MVLKFNFWARTEPPRPVEVSGDYEVHNNRGVLIPVVPAIFSEGIADLVRAGHYEEHEAAELDSLIRPDEIILEIGAGCGFISTYCAKNPCTKSVHCVEANPDLIDLIHLTHRLNNVTASVYNEILAREDGEADFFLHKDFWGSGTISSLGTANKPVIKVPTTRFQRRLDEIRPTMLVIDVEGGEETLFEDVSLTSVQRIMLELHPHLIGRSGVKRLFDLLSAQGFCYDVWHSTRSIVTFSHVDCE